MRSSLLAATLTGSLLGFSALRANVSLPSILSDHMILQRSASTPVWGKAAPGETVKVNLDSANAQTTADTDGRWRVQLDLSSMSEGPFELHVEGGNRITISDVLVGQVWLCSGQSNIAYTLDRSTGAAEDIARSANSRLRQFQVYTDKSPVPLENCKGRWVVAAPDTAARFTAVGYYFAEKLQQSLNTPVGIVLSAWAGTHATAWTSEPTLKADPELRQILERGLQSEQDYPAQKAAYPAAMSAWLSAQGRADRPFNEASYAAMGASEQDWVSVNLPLKLKDRGLPDAGAVWFRRHITLPPQPHGDVIIDIGGPHDFDTVYWNGKKIAEITPATATGTLDSNRYVIPSADCHEGGNVLAIRVYTPTEKAGFNWQPFVEISPKRTLIDSDWLAKVEFALPDLTAGARKDMPRIPSAPDSRNGGARLYNAMISPIAPYGLAGVVWYQGEQDTGRSTALYRRMLSALIGDWRARWSAELPFIICQLPNYGPKTPTPGASQWADIREAQVQTVASTPRSALTVLIDVGDENVHPPGKKPVGERTALTALRAFYGQPGNHTGPAPKSLRADNGKLVLTFTGTETGLVAKPLPARHQPSALSPVVKELIQPSPGSQLQGFAVRGDDDRWVWAEAHIDGDTVVVSAPSVPAPVAVRYAWADNPTCNLYNAAGLPASPFEAKLP